MAISLPLALLHVKWSVEVLLTIATAFTGGGIDFCPEMFVVEFLTHFSMALDFWERKESSVESVISLETVLL